LKNSSGHTRAVNACDGNEQAAWHRVRLVSY
jgi:hypothetical protein